MHMATSDQFHPGPLHNLAFACVPVRPLPLTFTPSPALKIKTCPFGVASDAQQVWSKESTKSGGGRSAPHEPLNPWDHVLCQCVVYACMTVCGVYRYVGVWCIQACQAHSQAFHWDQLEMGLAQGNVHLTGGEGAAKGVLRGCSTMCEHDRTQKHEVCHRLP